ncbi:hypothetical protein K3756_16670 [Sulfitobacter sp. S190]|nr:hypothetical protein K3756_16670 [Sulfitobacter sp. S190]
MRLAEPIKVDQSRLGALYEQLGETGAEDVVCRAMEELAVRMAQCDRLYKARDRPTLRKNARSLIAIAEQIGMYRLAQVAADVTRCIDDENEIALAATLSRLLRIGDQSLSAIWDTQDLDQ